MAARHAYDSDTVTVCGFFGVDENAGLSPEIHFSIEPNQVDISEHPSLLLRLSEDTVINVVMERRNR